MEKTVSSHILYEMMTYYNERAPEYDEWFYRKGRYDMGPEMNAQWFVEIDEISTAFKRYNLEGAVLEIAAGTGIWTEQLLQTATSITAIDASAEMIAINRAKTKSERVSYLQADLFTWSPERTYDAIFFGFWISHVPYEQIPRFLSTVAGALRPGGKLFFVDNRREPVEAVLDNPLPEEETQIVTRRLKNDRTFEIVKNFYEPDALSKDFADAGLDIKVSETPLYFIYGCGTRHVL